MGSKLVICGVLGHRLDYGPSEYARVGATNSIIKYLADWTNSFGEFLPVAAIRMEPESFLRVAELPRLPKTILLNRAAELFGRVPIAQEAQVPIMNHIQRLHSPGVLLDAWRAAVDGARR